MKKLFLMSVLSLTSFSAFSMPCDTGYYCKSKSGKYKIELNRCRYVNSLKLLSVKINNKNIEGAELGPAWDGQSVGDLLLAFQVNLPTKDDSVSILSVETSSKFKKGLLKEKFVESEPGEFKVLFAEPITCRIQE